MTDDKKHDGEGRLELSPEHQALLNELKEWLYELFTNPEAEKMKKMKK